MVVENIPELTFPYEKYWMYEKTMKKVVVFQKNSLHSNFHGLYDINPSNAKWKLPPLFSYLGGNRIEKTFFGSVSTQGLFLIFYDSKKPDASEVPKYLLATSVKKLEEQIKKLNRVFYTQFVFSVLIFNVNPSNFPTIWTYTFNGTYIEQAYEDMDRFIEDIHMCVRDCFVGLFLAVPEQLKSLYDFREKMTFINQCISWYEAVFGTQPPIPTIMEGYFSSFPDEEKEDLEEEVKENFNEDRSSIPDLEPIPKETDQESIALTIPYTPDLEDVDMKTQASD